jgi:hypothetical protein
MLPSSLEVVPNLALNYLPSQFCQVWHARSTPRFNQSANKRNRKQPVWTNHLSLYISTVSPYKLKKRRSHQNCSEWQNESYGKCQFLQKLGSRLISHYSFGRKESRFLLFQEKISAILFKAQFRLVKQLPLGVVVNDQFQILTTASATGTRPAKSPSVMNSTPTTTSTTSVRPAAAQRSRLHQKQQKRKTS